MFVIKVINRGHAAKEDLNFLAIKKIGWRGGRGGVSNLDAKTRAVGELNLEI